MANPVFASMVQKSSVTLPVAGTISTYTPLLGLQGVIGVKSGFTVAAGGCDVLAVVRTVHGKPTLLLAAVTGQTRPGRAGAGGTARPGPGRRGGPAHRLHQVLPGNQVVAHVSEAGTTVDARTVSSASVLTWPGVTATRVFVPARHIVDQPPPGHARSERSSSRSARSTSPCRCGLERDIPPQTLLQRICRDRLA